jgi:hypothetical protein
MYKTIKTNADRFPFSSICTYVRSMMFINTSNSKSAFNCSRSSHGLLYGAPRSRCSPMASDTGSIISSTLRTCISPYAPDEIDLLLQWANIAQVIYCPLCFLVKMAILLQYLKLFAPSRSANKVMFFGSWITIIATLIAYVVFTFWTLFYCTPRRMIWYKLIPGGKCHNVNNIILAQGAFNMASDIIILLLPTASLWQLSVPLTKKIFVTLLFAMGLLYVYFRNDARTELMTEQSLRGICHAHCLHDENRTSNLRSRRISQRSLHRLMDGSRSVTGLHRSLCLVSTQTGTSQRQKSSKCAVIRLVPVVIDYLEVTKERIADEFSEKHTVRLKGIEAVESNGCWAANVLRRTSGTTSPNSPI